MFFVKALLRYFTCFFISIASSTAIANSDPNKIQTALVDAAQLGVDQEFHQTFWGSLSEDEILDVKDTFVSLELFEDWQYEVWQSAYETAKEREVTRTLGYQRRFSELREIEGQDINLSKAEDMLAAIAAGKPVTLPQNTANILGVDSYDFAITEELALLIRDSIALNFDRWRTLLSPTWPPKSVEHSYPDQGLRYTANERLVMRPFDTGMPNVLGWEVSQKLNIVTDLEAVVYKYNSPMQQQADHISFMEQFTNLGINNILYSEDSWQGKPRITSVIVYTETGTKFYGASTTVIDKEKLTTYNFTINSLKSTLDALEKSINFMTRLELID